MVILCHSHPYFAGISNYHLQPVVETIIQNGDKGVTLFFLMSAFTLCLSLNSKQETEERPILNYAIRRVFRIVPLHVFIVILILLVRINSPSIMSVIANLCFIHGTNPLWINSTVPGGWSVGIEVIFYLIFPLLFFKIKTLPDAINLTLISIVLAKVVTSLMFKHPLTADGILWGVYIYENIFSQLPVFLIGMSLFHFQYGKRHENDNSKSYTSYLFIAGLIVVHLCGGNLFKLHYLFAIAMVLFALGLSKVQPLVIVNKLTVALGKLSYSIYLTHLVVANLLVKYHFNHYNHNPLMDIAMRFFIITAISVSVSVLTYKFIELPFQAYGKYLINNWEHKYKTLTNNQQ